MVGNKGPTVEGALPRSFPLFPDSLDAWAHLFSGACIGAAVAIAIPVGFGGPAALASVMVRTLRGGELRLFPWDSAAPPIVC